MANASKKHMGAGAQGKGTGSGANSEISRAKVGANMVLSNRDKSNHPKTRGQDGKYLQTEQLQDHPANRLPKRD